MQGDLIFRMPGIYKDNPLVERFGAIIKEKATGHIVAHVQETGLAQRLLNAAGVSPFSPLGALNAASSAGANIQLVQMKRLVEGLQILQFANLGVSIAGLGVSAVGFALMNKKLNSIIDQMGAFSAQVYARFDQLRERELRTHYSRIDGLFDQAEQAHALRDPSKEWYRVAGALADESSYFRGEVRYLNQSHEFSLELFDALTRSYALCNMGRIECLMLAREMPAARRVAQDVATDYNSLFDDLVPIRLAHNSLTLEAKTGVRSDATLSDKVRLMSDLVGNLRQVQQVASTKPYLIDMLLNKEVDGFEYMRRLREENEEPILLLLAA